MTCAAILVLILYIKKLNFFPEISYYWSSSDCFKDPPTCVCHIVGATIMSCKNQSKKLQITFNFSQIFKNMNARNREFV